MTNKSKNIIVAYIITFLPVFGVLVLVRVKPRWTIVLGLITLLYYLTLCLINVCRQMKEEKKIAERVGLLDSTLKRGSLVLTPDCYYGIVTQLSSDTAEIFIPPDYFHGYETKKLTCLPNRVNGVITADFEKILLSVDKIHGVTPATEN